MSAPYAGRITFADPTPRHETLLHDIASDTTVRWTEHATPAYEIDYVPFVWLMTLMAHEGTEH